MAEITLQAESGRPSGTSAAKRLRREGKIPAVVYGHGIEPISIAVDGRELRHALTGDAGLNALLALAVDGTDHLAMAKVLQRDPVRGTVTHVDFQIVRRDEVVTADVPIHITGEAKAVQAEGGLVENPVSSLTVHATPGRIPAALVVDIGGLTVGDAIRVADLDLPAGVATDTDADEVVVIAHAQQVSELDLIPEADAEALKELAEAQAVAEAEGGEPAAAGEAAAAGGAPEPGE